MEKAKKIKEDSVDEIMEVSNCRRKKSLRQQVP